MDEIYEDKKDLSDLLGELFLIIGGFIIAETIVRKFLDMANGKIEWYVLPLLALVLISAGISLKKGKRQIIYSIISWGWIFFSVGLIVLMKNNILTPENFLWWILAISLIQIISFITYLFKKTKKSSSNYIPEYH